MRIEGVYESQVPLLFRALLTFGCSCRLKSTFQTKASTTYNFEQLEPVSVHHQSLLKFRKSENIEIVSFNRSASGIQSQNLGFFGTISSGKQLTYLVLL